MRSYDVQKKKAQSPVNHDHWLRFERKKEKKQGPEALSN